MKILQTKQRYARLPGMVAATLLFTGCDAVNEAIDNIEDIGDDTDVYYYVSLGTSLSVGVRPNGSGVQLPTDDGYADQLFDLIRQDFEAGGQNRELRLTKLGCPGEDLNDMIDGGSCIYVAGSQLDAAVDFLTDNADKVYLLTIDIGGNDFRDADCITDTVSLDCADTVSAQISTDLAAVLTALSDAADPATTIVGMNYYNPFLASWLDGPDGQTLAMEAGLAGGVLNSALSTTYGTAGIAMADVSAAFESDDFTTMVPTALPAPNDMLPASVANICAFTYMCDADPRGPDIHANVAGYALIAATMADILP